MLKFKSNHLLKKKREREKEGSEEGKKGEREEDVQLPNQYRCGRENKHNRINENEDKKGRKKKEKLNK